MPDQTMPDTDQTPDYSSTVIRQFQPLNKEQKTKVFTKLRL